jgi:hypothetical protein
MTGANMPRCLQRGALFDFRALVDGVEYGYSSATFALDRINLPHLQTVTLRNGGFTSGYLVFEVPDAETITYRIIDTRHALYKFEYGHIPKVETEPEPEPIIRELSFNLGNQLLKISTDSLKGTIGYDTYSTSVSRSQSGTDTYQVTKVDRKDNGFLVVDIRTYLNDGDLQVDKNKAIEDALKEAEKYIPTYSNRIKKGGTYAVTLPTGEKADVHKWEAPTSELYREKADVCSFMPDDSTVVTVVVILT